MRKKTDGPVNPLLLGGATFVLFGGLLTLHKLGILDLPELWHYWALLLFMVG